MNLLKLSIAALVTFAFSVTASAVNVVNPEAGKLSEVLGDDTGIAELGVSGEINAADLDFIADKLVGLKELDISSAVVKAYSGAALRSGQTTSPANTIPQYVFVGSGVQIVTLPATVTAIGEGAFAGSELVGIDLANVTDVAAYAFKECPKLMVVSFGNSEIGNEAFAGCESLSIVTGSQNIVEIGDGTFKGCSKLTEFTFNSGLTKIGTEAFAASGLTAADLSLTSITELPENVFAECTDLASVTLPQSVEVLANGALFADGAIKTFNFPDKLAIIDDYAMYGMSGLQYETMYEIGEYPATNTALESIGKYGMAGMASMTQLGLPETVTYLGDYAMAGWTSLTDLSVRDLVSAPELGENVWNGVDQFGAYLYVTSSNEALFAEAEQWKEFNLTRSATVVDTPEIDDFSQPAIKAWLDGSVMTIVATAAIASVDIYDTTGRVIASVANIGEDRFSTETAQWQCRIFIVRVVLTDGTAAAVKLARR